MFNLNPKECRIIPVSNHLVAIALLEREVQFTTFKDQTSLNNVEDLGFYYTGQLFSLKDMLIIKDTLISMLLDYFKDNVGDYLKYSPSCPRRGKIYIKYLTKAGFTCFELGNGLWIIIYPH